MQIVGLARRVVSHVALDIGPAAAPAGAHQHDGLLRYGPVRRLEGCEIRSGRRIVGIARAARCNVDHEGGAGELFQRNFADRLLACGEVNRRVEVRSRMFARGKVVGTVPVAAVGKAPGGPLVPEGLAGRPENRLVVVGVGEIDQLEVVERVLLERRRGVRAAAAPERNPEKTASENPRERHDSRLTPQDERAAVLRVHLRTRTAFPAGSSVRLHPGGT